MEPTSGLDPRAAKLGLRLTLIVIAVVLVAIPFGILLLEVLFKGPLTRVDQHIADRQNADNLRDGDRVQIAQVVTHLGSTVVLAAIVVAVAVFLAVVHRRRRQALFLVTTAVLGVITNNIIKAVVGRSRPHFTEAVAHAFGKSFPSGHAMNSTVVYGSLLLLAWPQLHSVARRWIAATSTVVVVVSIAASRVALNVHFVSDVVAGIVLGAAFVLASAAAFKAWEDDGGRLPRAIEEAPTLGEGTGHASRV
ncbi:MAG TPA: phosphatase PAP2 family protein [Ilumatobacteraceae bacterium]|jgi:undecaprenyl-diphosphatase|nr:phosphatase PAP2 family protein [Ilumatobacteraceae bacterium]